MLVIEWDRERLILVSGDASGSAVTVRAAATVDRVAEQTAEQLGAQIRQALTSIANREESASVVLPRQLVTLRRVQLPNVSDDELPDMVKLQAATRLTVPLDSVALDFVPLPADGDGARDVLIVTTPRQHVDRIRTALTTAGLELAGLKVSSFGIAHAVALAGLSHRTADPGSMGAVMCLRSDLIELLVMKDSALVFSHSGAAWDAPEKIEQAVRQEISRGRLAATQDIGSHSIVQLTLIGRPDVTSAVPDSVAQRLDNAPIVRIDPAASLVQRSDGMRDELSASDLLAAAGVIAETRRPAGERIDLVNPRRPPEKVDNTRMKVILAVGLSALVLVGGWKWRDTRVQALQREATQVSGEAGKLNQTYKDAGPQLSQDEALRAWLQGDVNWIDEMVKIRALMGSTEHLVIREIDFLTAPGNYRGKITADCYAKSRRDVTEFMRRLEGAGYDVAPPKYASGSRDPDYPIQAPLELNIPFPEDVPVASTAG